MDLESADLIVSDVEDGLIGSTLLDSYAIDRVLGEGGMGRIYEAHHTRLPEKRFAIKVLRPELVSSPQIRARFEREVEAIARVNHPGVLTIVDVGTTGLGWPYMVSEHLSGLDLLAYVRRFGALEDERVVQMGRLIAEALEATHAQGVIHRDIKPSNIFLLGAFEPLGPEWDRVKIIDFGLSRFVSRDDQLTKTGIVMGTPAYMSPEQARGSRTDHLTDVYGVGAVLYAAATGVPPFREETQQETLLAVMSRDPVRPRALNAAISEGLELVIQRAMSKQPEERYASMSALRLALSNLELGARSASGSPRRIRDGGVWGVRFRIVALGSCALLLSLGALASVVSGFLGSAREALRMSTTERLLFVVVLGTATGLLLLWLQRLQQRHWRNTAKLAEWLPRLRVPLLASLVVYAVASFAVRFSEDVLGEAAWGSALAEPPSIAWPGWGAVLSLLALFAALAVALHQNWWQPMRPRRRWVWGLALTAGAVLAALAVARWGSLAQRAGAFAREPAADGMHPPPLLAAGEQAGRLELVSAMPKTVAPDAGPRALDVAATRAAAAESPEPGPPVSSKPGEASQQPAPQALEALSARPSMQTALTAAVAPGNAGLGSSTRAPPERSRTSCAACAPESAR